MTAVTNEQFARYAVEHARLYDPVSWDDEVRLVPVDLENESEPKGRKSKTKFRTNKKRRGGPPRPTGEGAASLQTRKESRAEESATSLGSGELHNVPPDPMSRILRAHNQWVSIGEELRASMGLAQKTEEPLPGSHVTPKRQEPLDAPRITIEPQNLVWDLALFNDHAFQVHAPRAEKVSLVWQQPERETGGRSQMDNTSPGMFETTIGIQDGDYLATYDVDGCTRPDSRYSQRIVVKTDGVFAPMRLARREKTIVLRNLASWDEVVRLESDSLWLVVADAELRLPAGGRAEAIVRVLSEKITRGRNTATLTASVHRQGNVVVAATTSVEVTLEAGGAVPEIRCRPSEFGWIVQGEDHLVFEVEVRAIGRGPLTGMIFLGHPGEAVDFQIEAGSNQSLFTRTFTIDSLDLPHRAEGSLKLTLVSDCYLSNYRLIELGLPYRLVYLKKSLPALTFGKVRHGLTRTLRLEVERSDEKTVELEVAVPESARRYLQAFRARPDAYSFMFDTRVLQVGDAIDEVVTLTDQASGLRDQVKVLAEVVGDRAEAVRAPAD
jgi:hypothetical protein